jgi:hypothetical protein
MRGGKWRNVCNFGVRKLERCDVDLKRDKSGREDGECPELRLEISNEIRLRELETAHLGEEVTAKAERPLVGPGVAEAEDARERRAQISG